MTTSDPFRTDLYDRLHRTPMQEKFRTIAPMPVGVVFIERPGMTGDDIRRHFRKMKELGFTCLKGIHLCPGTDLKKVMHAALDEGLIPWWYGEGGWEAITDDLLHRLEISPDTPIAEIRTNEAFLAHQETVFRKRIDAHGAAPAHVPAEDDTFTYDMDLPEPAVPRFVEWLKATYGTPGAVTEAWNMHHSMIPAPAEPWASWDDVRASLPQIIGTREYRRRRDVMRFKADLLIERIRRRHEAALAADPNAPARAGGEMGLFLPLASRSTDMEGIARVMADLGSFYPSIHLSWHFEEVDFEVPRPVYMQASLAQDWFKGGWAATWESTGGPQQLSGGKGWTPEGAARTAGATVDEGIITHLMLSYLAAGFKGFGFWCWSPRTAGWEAGEFALLDRNGEPTPRAIQAGRIGRAARRWRDELWQAHKEPTVGLFADFENDAVWAAISAHGREMFKDVPVHARIGAARALINHNVPWEHITGSDLRSGLAGRYKTIYLPAVIALPSDLLQILLAYVAEGGRLIIDLPGAWYDEYGRLLSTAPGTPFETIFGCTIRDMQYASNVPRSLDGQRLDGFVADLGVTHACVAARYDEGGPAVTEARCGQGSACVLAFEASPACYRPGNDLAESRLVERALGDAELPYACEGAIVYRLAAPAADHYFLINDGAATAVTLETKALRYAGATDAVSGEAVALHAPIEIPAYHGRWLRCEK